MGKIINMTGRSFERLTVIRFDRTENKKSYWVCRCSCGAEKIIRQDALTSHETKSCGCLSKQNAKANFRTHGEGVSKKSTKEYRTWLGMKQRCYNSRSPHFHRYGGRGIIMCDTWINSYEIFLSDMGRAPSPKHSIDRIDNNKGYYPENCRWATRREQMQNTSLNLKITYNGETKALSYWCDYLGVPYSKIYSRIYDHQWPIELALSEP